MILAQVSTKKVQDTTALQGVLMLKDELEDPEFDLYYLNGKTFRHLKLRTAFGILPIEPYALSEHTGQLVFRCISKTAQFYKVLSNETTKEQSLIKTDDVNFQFQDWETHIEHAAMIEPLITSPSPLRKDTLGIDTLIYDKSHNLVPIELEGNWLKVTWQEGYGGTAWIRWRNFAGTPLIRLYYHD